MEASSQMTYPEPYPTRGGWRYLWYERPAVRWAAAFLAIAVIGLLAWLLVIRPDTATSSVRPGGGPVAASEQQLVDLSHGLHQPVYWAGTMPGTKMELTETTKAYPYVRYLTGSASIGDPSPGFLTVGTYPTVNAFNALRSYAHESNARLVDIQRGGIAVPVPGSPTSVYFAYPDQDAQVEVYDPQPGRALTLVKTGVVKPVTEQQPALVGATPPGS
jgi:hypothetical protein